MKKRSMSPPAVGGSSLLVIFAVLCLTVFAALSLTTVTADTRLSRQNAESVAEFYAADTLAEEVYASIRRGDVPKGVTVEGDTYTYIVSVSETRVLQVELRRTGEDFTVIRWQTMAKKAWQADDTLIVWGS